MPHDSVAQLGVGLAAVGRPAYLTLGRDADLPADRAPAVLQARTSELLDAATALGIEYVDTARSYGRAEEFLASWLSTTDAAPFVASKWGYRYTADWRPDATVHEVKEHTEPAFERQLAETTALLGPWLKLYQVHSLTADSPLWTDRPLQHRLARLRADGVELGFSTSGPAQADAVRRGLELTVDGAPLFTSVQSTWNLLEPSAGPALAEASAAGARVVVKEGVANGRLTDRGTAPDSPLAAAARERGAGVDAVALAAALAQPWCDVVLSGAVTVAQLESNAAARTLDLTAADPTAAGWVQPEEPAEYWSARSRLSWR
ncbi:aldo/keto reductase [Modestobacter sp. VKM Ac-2979]|uniref:aldo/keto reductase n=1 Tax=unclassified Modestobacter TaxID=2643866 RepID=UPI0022AB7B98|nr:MULTISPECIES: aldo/keto reductase [unclassified Modestobacter]MCZ2811236.1 aldo/keto reductase [Modestobacter sp. VKM Ac-2979]MCZ2840749.1 aldo/keto reductase [Modestobacter sp. VKM Ac-2980]